MAARTQYDRSVQAAESEAREHNAAVDELELSFRAGTPEAVEEFFGQVLALSEFPEGFPREYQVAYRPDPRELVVEYRLPPATVIPVIRDYRYVKARGEIDELPRLPCTGAVVVRPSGCSSRWVSKHQALPHSCDCGSLVSG